MTDEEIAAAAIKLAAAYLVTFAVTASTSGAELLTNITAVTAALRTLGAKSRQARETAADVEAPR